MDLQLERWPDADTVRQELTAIQAEKAVQAFKDRQAFITELKHNLKRSNPYRDTRPKPRRVLRRRSMADFTAKQTLLAERILNDLANKAGGNPHRN